MGSLASSGLPKEVGDSSPRLLRSERGIALIITLILLSVTLIMAVAFLAISRRERGSVTTSTDTATARLAADAALASAEAQIIANVLATTNSYLNNLLVSTNYINANGFDLAAGANPTNVNFDYQNDSLHTPLLPNQFVQNVANLFYLPRAPVFVPNPTNSSLPSDFRFYLDLNRNGKFEDTGSVTNLDNNGAGLGSVSPQVGDPQWIGVLERPDAPHGPNNKFLSRYAFIALPADGTLDLNYIHNQALNQNLSAADGYFRNQGVGSWEINLAAFLADLNTNEWGQVIGTPANGNATYYYYQYNPNNAGTAFDDARALLAWRYNGLALPWLSTLFPNYPLSGPVDILPWGTAMTGTGVPFYNYSLDKSWPGADNTDHYFALSSDLFDPTKTQLGVTAPALGFTDHLLQAGNANSTYDRYTFYRLLAQLGTDSSPESGKMNLNYDNLNPYRNGVLDVNNGVASVTNFIPWTPIAFFTNAADRMLRVYTTNWFQADPPKYLATYYGFTNAGGYYTNNPGHYFYIDGFGNTNNYDQNGFGLINIPLFGMTNQIPAFGVTNIPVYVNGQYVYSSAMQRVLQLAANIYDATTNSFFPDVFRPTFWVTNELGYKNVYINGYEWIYSSTQPDFPLASVPVDVTSLPAGVSAVNYPNGVNVYGVPWIIGAKKGFPNFNEFSMNNVVQITRKLQITKANAGFPPQFSYTNVSYVFGIGSSLGIEFWNSYTNNYLDPVNPVQIVVRDTVSMTLTNGAPPYTYPFTFPVFANVTSLATWSNTAPYDNNGKPQPNSFVFQTTNIFCLTNQAYVWGGGFAPPNVSIWQTSVQNLPALPQFGLLTTNRLQTYILDGNHIIDYAQFSGPSSSRNLNAEIQSVGSAASYENMWTTNVVTSGAASGLSIAILNQINASRDNGIPLDSSYWQKNSVQPSDIDGFFVFMGGSPGALPLKLTSAAATNAFKGYLTNLVHQTPFTPTVTVYDYTTWQANDPLVHYLGSDLNFSETDISPPTGLSRTYKPPVSFYGSLANIGYLNDRYAPWGKVHVFPASDINPYNYAYKDPLATSSDDWNFPANKLPTVGWLGRVHRGTPWQTVYLKAKPIDSTTWANWTGNQNGFDATNSMPTKDFSLFDIFTTAPNDNATRGQLSVNVAADTNNPAAGLAAWSALFSGMVVPTSLTNTYTVINPAGPAGVPVPAGVPPNPNSPLCLGYLVQNGTNGINDVRATFKNPDGLVGAFEHVGNILAVPALSERSPFLAGQNFTNGVSDALMEWLPQQTMSLLRADSEPRYVIYCYGQTLKPAPGGIVTGGTQFGMITNYQVVAETATRAVVQFKPVVQKNLNGNLSTNYSPTIEQFNLLPPD